MYLKIISSNIRFDDSSDKDHRWEDRRPILSECLLQFAPDLIGTQEGRQPQILELAQELEPLNLICSHRDWIEKRMYPCFFYNPNTIEILQSGDIWLSDTPNIPGSSFEGSMFPRLCTWLLASWKLHKTLIFAVNTHLDHQQTETRQKQIGVLLSEIQKIKPPDTLALLMGDFNEKPGDPVYQKVQMSSFPWRDPWIEHDKKEEESYHNFRGKLKSGHRIDWLWVDKRLKCKDIFLDKSSDNGKYPSDHFPLKTILSL
ncbi:MAG: endonuclease/exonuclease/phosphatase family protein [Halobacteriovoraceae bacterium]|nr:endonuclease/exonuclease/phosphatase family protein [Halobacteriovoraceae bacterium]